MAFTTQLITSRKQHWSKGDPILMVRNPQILWNSLGSDELKVLKAIESLMSKYEYAPVEFIERRLKLPAPSIKRAIDRLNESKLIKRKLGSIIGYSLTYYGLDVLALDALIRRGIIERLGDRIGVGKEGNVYLATSTSGRKMIVKFHREGRISFKKIRILRRFASQIPRKHWLHLAKLAGEREFRILVLLSKEGALVPRGIAWNRNAVVQEYIPGIELYRIRDLPTQVAERVLSDVVETIKIAYHKVGVVHGDLSEYNILVSNEGREYIIDWPQYVYREDENADDLLRRDLYYVARYFSKKYRLPVDLNQLYIVVRGDGSE